MADEVQIVEAPKEYDFAAFKAARDKGEPTPPAAAAAVEATPAKVEPTAKVADADDADDHTPTLPRSVRRELNKLRVELGETRGQLAMLRELQQQGFTKAEAKAEVAAITEAPAGEPTRDQFASDAEYYRALGRFDAKAEISKVQNSAAQEASNAAFMAEVAASTTKFEADVAGFPDWAEVVEAMDEIKIDTVKNQTFIGLLAKSDMRAAILYHLAKHQDEREKLFASTPEGQISYFHRLEGRLERKSEGIALVRPKPTTAELDAKKAKPSASVAAKGATGAEGTPSMMLPDGRTLNPAWKAARNAAHGIRP